MSYDLHRRFGAAAIIVSESVNSAAARLLLSLAGPDPTAGVATVADINTGSKDGEAGNGGAAAADGSRSRSGESVADERNWNRKVLCVGPLERP
ncbi:hypothetical protein BASA60_010654, partial [Batrachochytrium salamandrivorans]